MNTPPPSSGTFAPATAAASTVWPSRLAAATTLGFAAAVAVWVVWFLMHMPITVEWFPPRVAGPLLLAVTLAVLLLALVRLPSRDRLSVGLMAGLVTGLVNLLILGSKLTQPLSASSAATAAAGAPPLQAAPGASGLVPSAGLMVVGYLAAMAITGVVAGFGASSLGGPAARVARTPRQWLATYALVNAVAVLPLLTLGGVVTSARAGFAVPDWPGTYGANMFLYPISLMSDPRIFLEHTHRLFGAMVGLTTLVGCVFACCCWRTTSARTKAFAALLLVLVIVQGLLGAEWVVNMTPAMVIGHGVLGQVFFALVAAYATGLSEKFRNWRAAPADPAVATPTTAAPVLLGLLVVQLVMGTMARHLGSKGVHPLYTHIALSMVILVLGIVLATRMMKHKPVPVHGRGLWLAGHNVMVSIGLQFLLGWVALLGWMAAKDAPALTSDQIQAGAASTVKPWTVLVRTIHQANGALVLASATIMAMWAWKKRA